MKFKQWCDNCNSKVEIETDSIEVVKCPNCGKPLMPCPICHGKKVRDDLGCKRGCTLKNNYINEIKKFNN